MTYLERSDEDGLKSTNDSSEEEWTTSNSLDNMIEKTRPLDPYEWTVKDEKNEDVSYLVE